MQGKRQALTATAKKKHLKAFFNVHKLQFS